jgi:hypothetical protein
LLAHGNEAAVGDTNPVSVAAKIANDLLRTSERPLRVDNPAGPVERLDIDGAEIDPAPSMSALEGGDHLSAKERAHDVHREEKGLSRSDPS